MSLGYPYRCSEITGNEILQKESAKLHALRAFLRYMSRVVLALVPHCLVPYVLPCLTCLVLSVFSCLTCLVPYVLSCLTCLAPCMVLCLTCLVRVCVCVYTLPPAGFFRLHDVCDIGEMFGSTIFCCEYYEGLLPSSLISIPKFMIFHLQRRNLQLTVYWRENDMILCAPRKDDIN